MTLSNFFFFFLIQSYNHNLRTSPEKVYDEYENGKINEIEIYKMDSTFKAGYSKE